MKPPTVAILRTSPSSVLEDIHRLMNLAGYRSVIRKNADTALKLNISWHFYYPAASTTPWQLDGVIRSMKRDGYSPDRMHACHNRTVVIDARLGERENKHIDVIRNHGLRNIHLYDDTEEWIDIREAVGKVADRFLALNRVYPDGFSIPRRLVGENIIHLPTVKTHVFTSMTGSMKNAFGGLLNERRHWTHPVIHETLVDLLMIQKSIHSGIFSVMDGTIAGDGPGPRCMTPHLRNVLLASADSVAIDAVAAKLMGFDPMSIRFIRLAHETGLGMGELSGMELAGDADVLEEDWGFVGPFKHMTFASRMQHLIYWGPLKKILEWSLKTFLAPWAYIASVVYHDMIWYPLHGRTVLKILQSDWGKLFQNWREKQPPAGDLKRRGWEDVGSGRAQLKLGGFKQVLKAFSILGTVMREAPEYSSFRKSRFKR